MKNKTKAILFVIVVGSMLCTSGAGVSKSMEMVADGAVTPLLQYQGRLTNPTTGENVADGSYSMTFNLYNVDTGGTAWWSESESVTVHNGLFSTVLGDTVALDHALFNGQALWLGITVGGEDLGPRQQVLPVAYALSLVPGAIVAANSSPVLEVDHTSGGEALRVGGNLSVSGSLIGGSHTHAGEAITSGTVADARIASTLARDNEIMPTVLASDGSGSTLDADLLDGQQGAFYQNASNLNAGTLSTNQYSAYSDLSTEGYLGGASGDVALNNGVTQSNLSSDMVDGYHANALPGAVLNYTVFNVSCHSLASIDITYRKIYDIGTFSKLNASSKLEITFSGRVGADTVTNTGAVFELRVDDVATTNGRARANIKASEVGGSNGVPATIMGIFTGYGAGNHTISIWVQTSYGTGTYGGVDPGCWSTDTVIVKEIR